MHQLNIPNNNNNNMNQELLSSSAAASALTSRRLSRPAFIFLCFFDERCAFHATSPMIRRPSQSSQTCRRCLSTHKEKKGAKLREVREVSLETFVNPSHYKDLEKMSLSLNIRNDPNVRPEVGQIGSTSI